MGLAKEIYKLTEYGVRSNLIEEEDRNYIINRYLEVFGADEFVLSEDDRKRVLEEEIDLQTVLDKLIDDE